MKINGTPVTPPTEGLLVLPRSDKEFVFRSKPLPDFDKFNALVPLPEPPGVLTKDGWVPDVKDKNYVQVITNYHLQRNAFLVIHTLEPSNIEWDKVDINNPKTWNGWEKEMRDAGFTQPEVNCIFQFVIETNSLSEEKLRVARESFLRGQVAAQAKSSGPQTEQATTQSGEPVTASA